MPPFLLSKEPTVAIDYTKYPPAVYETYKTAGARIPNPAHPLVEGVKASTLAFAADSGHEQRRTKAPPKRTFQLTYPVLTADQYKTLRDFFIRVLNTYDFTWVHPVEKTELNVKFSMETFSGENCGYGPTGALYKLQVSLEQVW